MNQTYPVQKYENDAATIQLDQSNRILNSDHTQRQVLIKILHRHGKKTQKELCPALHASESVPKHSTT